MCLFFNFYDSFSAFDAWPDFLMISTNLLHIRPFLHFKWYLSFPSFWACFIHFTNVAFLTASACFNKKPSCRWGTARRVRAIWNLANCCTNVDDLHLNNSENDEWRLIYICNHTKLEDSSFSLSRDISGGAKFYDASRDPDHALFRVDSSSANWNMLWLGLTHQIWPNCHIRNVRCCML